MDVPSTPSTRSFAGSSGDPPIVDGTILEAAKENIQPLARGRRATALSQVLTTPHRERPQLLAQERDAMRAKLQQAIEEDEDPLGAYVAFVDWTVESYPQGHNSDSGLITLFDEATRTLKDDPRYKNDLRYLKLWILYASHVEKPVDMFAFLLANDIGSVYSMLYEEYALSLERDGRRSEADEIYRLGINRRARPLERLQTRHKEFQLRMMAGPLHEAPAPAPPTTKRKALGEVKSSVAASTQPLRGGASSNASIQPYVDDENGPVDEPGNEWPEFGSRASRVKENTREVERAGDVKLKLKSAPGRSTGIPLEVFCDENPSEPTGLSAAHTNAMTPSKGTSEAELLRRDPFRNYGKDIPCVAAPTFAPATGSSGSSSVPKTTGIISNPFPNLLALPAAGKRPEKHRFKLELLWAGGVESCIQESRARAAGLLGKKWPAPPSGEAISVDFNDNGAKTSKGFLSGAGLIPSEPTVTINTKAALADVYGMFNSPTRSMRLQPMEEIELPPVVDAIPSSKKAPSSRALSDENAFRPPPSTAGKADEQCRKRPPSESVFVTPIQPKKARADKPVALLSNQRPVLTPLRDTSEDAVTPKASSTTFQTKPSVPQSKILVFNDHEDSAPKTPFRPFIEGDDSVIIAQPRATPSFEPFVDEEPDAPEPVFQPFVDSDEDIPSFQAPAFEPFVDDLDHPMSHGDEPLDCTPFVQGDGNTSPRNDAGFMMDGTATMELTDSGPPVLNLPNPCNPYSSQLAQALLGCLGPDPCCHHFEPQVSKKWASLQKMKPRKSKDSSSGDNITLQLHTNVYTLVKKLGEGAFGAVFSAEVDKINFMDNERVEESDNSVAIKVIRPSTSWEFYMLRRLLQSLPPDLHASFVHPHGLYSYADESFFVMDLNKHGTLLEVVNNINSTKLKHNDPIGLDEPLVIFFAIELLRVITGMHSAGFIHGDLKIDNCMVRLDDAEVWSSTYDASGGHGWSSKGIRLIDFGRMLDTQMFPPGQQFTCDWESDKRDCPEIREGRPWTYQTDYFGLANIVYTMLFGQHMDSLNVQDGRYEIKQTFKRYWQKDIWTRFFSILLNPVSVHADGSMPICDALSELRADMEKFLQANKTIKGLLRKIEISMC